MKSNDVSPGEEKLSISSEMVSQFGKTVAKDMLGPFVLGDKEFLEKLFANADFANSSIETKR